MVAFPLLLMVFLTMLAAFGLGTNNTWYSAGGNPLTFNARENVTDSTGFPIAYTNSDHNYVITTGDPNWTVLVVSLFNGIYTYENQTFSPFIDDGGNTGFYVYYYNGTNAPVIILEAGDNVLTGVSIDDNKFGDESLGAPYCRIRFDEKVGDQHGLTSLSICGNIVSNRVDASAVPNFVAFNGTELQLINSVVNNNRFTSAPNSGYVINGSGVSASYGNVMTGNVVPAGNYLSVVNGYVYLGHTLGFRVHGNSGFVTENVGFANVVNGAWVEHGLSGVPSSVVVTYKYGTHAGHAVVAEIVDMNATRFQIDHLECSDPVQVVAVDAMQFYWVATYIP